MDKISNLLKSDVVDAGLSIGCGLCCALDQNQRTIFKKGYRAASFTRHVLLEVNCLSINDFIDLQYKKTQFSSKCSRATRFSARHVASASNFSDVGSIKDWADGIHTKFTKKSR